MKGGTVIIGGNNWLHDWTSYDGWRDIIVLGDVDRLCW